MACTEEARSTVQTPTYAPGGVPSPTVSFLAGAIKEVRQERAEAKHVDACMRKQGYGKIMLSAAERASRNEAVGDKEKSAWLAEFLRHDNAQRIAAALKPRVVALPSIRLGEAFAIQGVQLEPSTLQAVDGPVSAGQAVVTGQASFRARAIIEETYDLDGPARARLEKGATLSLVELPPGPDDDQSSQWWCGPVTITTVFGATPQRPGCVRSTFDGYEWFYLLEKMQPLLTESINQPLSGLRGDEEMHLVQIGQGSERISTEFRIDHTDRHRVDLVLVALVPTKPVPLWRGTVPLNTEGVGLLTLWSKVLSVRRNGDGTVLARLTDDGDGSPIESNAH